MLSLLIFFLLVLHAPPAQAQPVGMQVLGATATQVLVYYKTTTTSDCTFELSESSSYSPLVNDVNSSLFTSANSDSRFSSLRRGLERWLVLGTKTVEVGLDTVSYSRALRADTLHYLRVTCGSAVSLTFVTDKIGGIPFVESGFLSSAHGNWGTPDFDWSDRSKPVIDAATGAAVYRITDPADVGFQENQNFFAQFGGTGWTSPGNLISGVVGTLATTSNTNSAFAAVDLTLSTIYGGFAQNEGWPRLSALAARIFGSGTDATSTNRQVDVCISVDSGGSCYTSTIRITLPQTTAAEVGVFPTQFPVGNFTGWSKPIPSEYWTTSGSVTVSGSTVTLTLSKDGSSSESNPGWSGSYFRPEWVSGTKIFIAGSSSACTGNYCTVASVQNRKTLTINESLTIGSNAAYKSAALGIRVVKTNATGSISVSASSRVAAYLAQHQGQGQMCSSLPVSTTVDRNGTALGRTITGRLCVVTRVRDVLGRLYFIGESEPEYRLLSMNARPASIAGHSSGDLPGGPGFFATGNISWSEVSANTYFLLATTVSGSPALFSLTYSGDYRENATALWSYSAGGSVTSTDPVTWNNLFKGSLAARTQILANTTYDEAKWPSLTGLVLGGIVRNKAGLYILQTGQDLPCAVFFFDVTSGLYEHWLDTLGNGIGGVKFAGCHSIASYGNSLYISSHKLQNSNTSTLYGGPFTAVVTHVLRSGSPSTNTALPEWTDGTYDAACPTDIAQLYKDMGAVGNECVTIRIAAEPCSATPTTAEKGYTPCAGDANKSWIGKALEPGDSIQDVAKAVDDEHLTIVKRTNLSGTTMELVMLRDSSTGYACQTGRLRGRFSCAASPSQAQHLTGWTAFFQPLSGSILINPVTGTITDLEDESLTRGHFDIASAGTGLSTYVGIGDNGYVGRVNSPYYFNPLSVITQFSRYPSFSSVSPSNAFTQSYIAAPTSAAVGLNTSISTDWRHVNSANGAEWETPGQTVGSTLTFTLQGGTSSVYKISPLNGTLTDYKRQRITAWAGHYVLGEKSGVGLTLTDSDAWNFCYVLIAGECRSGSSIGDFFAVIPKLETTLTQCHVSQVSYRNMCAFALGNIQTQVTQVRIDKNDSEGTGQRSLGRSLTRPGAQYVYSHARSFGEGRNITSSVIQYNGWFTGAVMIAPGDFKNDTVNRNTFRPVTVVVAPGIIPNRAIVRFWYSGANEGNGFCSPRQENCYAVLSAVSEATPFLFANELNSTSGVSCSSGCVVAIPGISGRVLYYEIVENISGSLRTLTETRSLRTVQ